MKQNPIDVVSVVFAGVAVLIAIGALWANIRSARAAERANEIAENAQRVSDEAHQMVQTELSPYRSDQWRLTPVSKSRYALHNDTGESAVGIRVEGHRMVIRMLGGGELDDGDETSVIIQPAMGSDHRVELTWRRAPDTGDEREYRKVFAV